MRGKAFPAAYTRAFSAFIAKRGEAELRAAYELGREAVTNEVSVLDLALAHHDALAEALADTEDAPGVARAAGDFFLEALSAYEMVQRGFREAREAAVVERRQAQLMRQLSNFLADASLALGASDSLDEMLQLVAEQARELTGADTCVVRLELEGERPVEAASSAGSGNWSRLLEAHLDDPSREQTDEGGRTLNEPLTTLAGERIGSIEVSSEELTELDAAVLVQLAQMASAAVERRRLYRRT
jgi:Phosphoserine phosphatase RsbU, N-terminal domain